MLEEEGTSPVAPEQRPDSGDAPRDDGSPPTENVAAKDGVESSSSGSNQDASLAATSDNDIIYL